MRVASRLARRLLPRGVRNWLRAPRESARWVWGELLHLLGRHPRIEVRPAWPLVCHPVAHDAIRRYQILDPDQVSEFDQFIQHCRPEMVLFDIGAHFGIFSLAALHYGGGGSRAVAVDPSPMAVRIIRIQSRLNGLDSRLRIVQACVGERSGRRDMVASGVISGGFFVAPGEGHGTSECLPVEAITLDGLASELGLRPTHVKIDVEGEEASVLAGGRRLLAGGQAPLLFIELHNEMVRARGAAPERTLELLKGFGYDTFVSDGKRLEAESMLRCSLLRIMARKGASYAA